MEKLVPARPRPTAHGTESPRDQGSALIITLLVLAVLTALAATVTSVTVNNLGASLKSQQAGAALNAADAGVAQATAYLRNEGVGGLTCSPTCANNRWGNSSAPATYTVPGGVAGQAYAVWIEPIAPYPANKPGRYRIHSTGTAKGSARREVEVDIQVSRPQVPLGLFARTMGGAGDTTLHNQSLFSTGCIYLRSKIKIDGIDAAYGIPAGVHSSQIITDSQGTNQYCSGTNKPIHSSTQPCNTNWPNDQDRLGGSLLSTSCSSLQVNYPLYYGRTVDGDGNPVIEGSYLRDEATLMKQFGFNKPALSDEQLAQLRATAQAQGNFWTTSNGWRSPTQRQAVMYFDLTNAAPSDRTVNLQDIDGFSRPDGTPLPLSAGDPRCDDRSLIVIIEGGNARLSSNKQLAASVFLISSEPYGQILNAGGTSLFIGTIYSDTVSFAGTVDVWMDDCFISHVAPGVTEFNQTRYRELDR
jgi:hypothetical protein